MGRRRFAVLFVLGTAAAAAGLWGQTSMSLSPALSELSLAAGKTEERVLTIGNDSPDDLRIRTEIAAWIPGSVGVDIFPAGDAAAMSCRDWIRLDATEFTVPGRQVRDVTVQFSVPPGTEPGHYSAAVSVQAVSDGTGEGLRLQGKLSALVVVAVGKVRNEGTITDLAVENENGRSILVLRHKNLSRFFLPTEGEFVIRNESGKKIQKGDIYCDPVPPLSERVFRVPLDAPIPPGRYEAECVLKPLSGKKESLSKAIVIGRPGKP